MIQLKKLAMIGLISGLPAVILTQSAPPVVGPCAPGAMQTKHSAEEAQAKVKVIVQAWDDLIDHGNKDEALAKYVSKDFVDHPEMARKMDKISNPEWEATKDLFQTMIKSGDSKLVQKIAADDNIVTAQGRIGEDIYRVKYGMITDHWEAPGGFTGGGVSPGGASPVQ